MWIKYCSTSLSKEYASSVAGNLRSTIQALASNSALHFQQLDAVSGQEWLKMVSWNPKNPWFEERKVCMHHLVEAKCRQIPITEAVSAWDGSLTYAQLSVLSEAFAQRLIQLGVKPGVYVPFCYEKSLWTVVIMLSILKAGGAFVPLNPGDPEARLGEILKDVSAHVVITMTKFAARFQRLVEHVEVVPQQEYLVHLMDGLYNDEYHCTHRYKPNAQRNSSRNSVNPSDPIFVLFTSGSTGQPKGIVLEHSAICTHALTHGKALGFQGARVLQFAAHTFDVAIMDVFTTLIYGGCICIPSEEDRRNNVIGFMNSRSVDLAILTPSFAGLIDPADVPSLKTLAIGGEALPQDRILRWSTKVSLIQIFGPAEAGIILTMEMSSSTAPETVGRPLPGCFCILVDPDDSSRLVPIGAVGELLVAGPTLARGYLNKEAKTRSSFIAAPQWAKKLGLDFKRFYKTGDLLRYNTMTFDGSYDFLGRKDSQIKVRGQRIEPGEVEHHINSMPEVAFAMVTWPKSGYFSGDFVAVVQMHGDQKEPAQVREECLSLVRCQSLSAIHIQKRLQVALPYYMIPTVCLVIDCMPFVPSLKMDKTRVNNWLTNMKNRPPELEELSLPQLDPSETTAKILSIEVARLIGKDRHTTLEGHDFGLQDVGIDSIQIISLSMFLKRKYGRTLPMDVLLDSKITIRELAKFVDLPLLATDYSLQLSHIIDLAQEFNRLKTLLFESFQLKPNESYLSVNAKIRNIFLTGATGYLGSAILQQLMAMRDTHVFALVRCMNEEAGFHQVRAIAERNGWWQDHYASRIHIWSGDLAKPNLGLGISQFQQLQGNYTYPGSLIHAVIHNGAKVHYSSNYEALKRTNIGATLELLKTTTDSSTISTFVFVSGGLKPNFEISDSSSLAHLSHAGGYTQTKSVSEQLVQACLHHPSFKNKFLQIVRPGYIIGSNKNTIANRSDFIWRLIAGCVDIGAFNADEASHWIFIAPVDRVAQSVVGQVFAANDATALPSSVERVLDGLRFKDIWQQLEEEFGWSLQPLIGEIWMENLKRRILEVGEKHLLFPLLHVLERDGRRIGDQRPPPSAKKVTADVIRNNVRYLINVGILPAAAKKTIGKAQVLNGVSCVETMPKDQPVYQ
ncbi:MAG: hypothetical protein LQ342_005844 [Letrouitia transgressa]|nr:MAG: hypothetical protein LQ342_005844 [Letrouitia transgressa]